MHLPGRGVGQQGQYAYGEYAYGVPSDKITGHGSDREDWGRGVTDRLQVQTLGRSFERDPIACAIHRHSAIQNGKAIGVRA